VPHSTAPAALSSLPVSIQEQIEKRSRGKTVALPESLDERVIEAARILRNQKGVEVLLPRAADVEAHVGSTQKQIQSLAAARGKTLGESALAQALDPFYFCGTQLAQGKVHAVVGGAQASTAHVIKAALATVGLAPGHSLITSAFLMALSRPTEGGEQVLLYSDGAVVPQPTAAQLAQIAQAAQQAFVSWTGLEPRLAFLSFSTVGSAQHPDVEKVREAYGLFMRQNPFAVATGEIQFDAATVPAVAVRKNPLCAVKGRANVFVFPDLDAGNIGYKITQRLAGAEAYGPVLLGSAKPFSDLSRGASVEDIVASALLTLALS
jgi:phosphate acetyltransferase